MTDAARPLPFNAVIVAAGKGLRAGQPVPKQFADWQGKPVVRHSADTLAAQGAQSIIVAIPVSSEAVASAALSGCHGITFVTGGATRQASVFTALQELDRQGQTEIPVLIHDAARPHIPADVISRLLTALEDAPGAIPVLPVVDSLVVASDDHMADMTERDALKRVQTPQAFHFAAVYAAHKKLASEGKNDAGDDAQVLHASGGRIALVEGDEALKKLTFAEDFMESRQPNLPAIRTGLGFDVHRLETGEELWLGGVQIQHDKGLSGHSDADVALHALVDAILGALGEGDIGAHFPPSDPQWRGAASSAFVKHAAKLTANADYKLANVDVTIICEAPKIGPHRDAMVMAIANMLGVDTKLVSVKATTTERLGLTGRGEGIAAQAIATLQRKETNQ